MINAAKTKDTLSRSDIKPVSHFASLSADLQRLLKRAASYGRVSHEALSREAVGDRDWIMVPSKRGLRQVVIEVGKAYRI